MSAGGAVGAAVHLDLQVRLFISLSQYLHALYLFILSLTSTRGVLVTIHYFSYVVSNVIVCRKDYLHPGMEKVDLWRILAFDEEWERLYSVRQKLSSLLSAVKDAADSRFEDKTSMVTKITFKYS